MDAALRAWYWDVGTWNKALPRRYGRFARKYCLADMHHHGDMGAALRAWGWGVGTWKKVLPRRCGPGVRRSLQRRYGHRFVGLRLGTALWAPLCGHGVGAWGQKGGRKTKSCHGIEGTALHQRAGFPVTPGSAFAPTTAVSQTQLPRLPSAPSELGLGRGVYCGDMGAALRAWC